MKEVPLYLHRETDEIIVTLNHDIPHSDNNHYVVQQGVTPPETLEQVLKLWKNNQIKEIPTQPTSQLWPLNYPNQRPNQAEVPLK